MNLLNRSDRAALSLERGNTAAYIAQNAAYSALLTLISNSIIQNYFLSRGMSTGQIGIIGTVGNIANTIGYFMLSSAGGSFERFSRYKKALAFSNIGFLIIPICIFLFTMWPRANTHTVFMIYCVIIALQSFCISFFAILSFTLPLRIINKKHVGRLLGVCGAVGGAAALGIGFLTSALMQLSDIGTAMRIITLMAIAFIVVSSVITVFFKEYKEDGDWQEETDEKTGISPLKAFASMCRLKSFRVLTPPNICRAAAAGAVYLLSASGILRFSEVKGITGYIVIAASAAGLLGPMLVALLHGNLGSGRLYLIGTVLSAAGILICAISPTVVYFIIGYFIAFIGQALIDNGFPLGIYDVVPRKIAGTFSSARLIVYYIAISISTALSGYVMEYAGQAPLFIATAAVTLGGGAAFYFGHKKLMKAKASA